MKIKVEKTEIGESREMETHQMTVAAEDLYFVLKNAIDAYSDTVLATIREYCANALDAHRAVGNTDPIWVSLPNPIKPVLVVKDEGAGLDKDELTKIFAQFYKSTKRETNSQIGGFGIGSKAGFTVSHQFMVRSVKDGHQIDAILTRSAGACEFKIAKESKTDAPNGVTITVPIQDKDSVTAYERTAKNLFYYWEPGEVEVAGMKLEHFSEKAMTIADDIHLRPGSDKTHVITLRMGGIPYRLSDNEILQITGIEAYNHELSRKLRSASYDLVIDIPIGDLELVQSREQIVIDGQSKKYLAEKFAYAEKTISDHYSKQITSQKRMVDAIRVYSENAGLFKNFIGDTVAFRGKAMPTNPKNENISALIAQITDKDRLESDTKINWEAYSTPVIVIDSKGQELATKQDSDKFATLEAVSLYDGHSGRVKRNIGGYLRSIMGKDMPGWNVPLEVGKNVIVVFAHQIKNDPLIMCRPMLHVRLDDLVETSRTFMAAQRKAKIPTTVVDPSTGQIVKAKKVAGGNIQYNVYGEKEQISLAQICMYDKVYFVRQSDLNKSAKYHWKTPTGPMDNGDKIFTDLLPENSVVIMLRSSQRPDAFSKRVEKEMGEAPASYLVWREATQKEMANQLTDIELHYIEQKKSGYERFINRLIMPLWEDGLITSDTWNDLVCDMREARTHFDTVDTVKIETVLRENKDEEMEKPENGMEQLLAHYPILAAIKKLNSYSLDEDCVKPIAEAINALDTVASLTVA